MDKRFAVCYDMDRTTSTVYHTIEEKARRSGKVTREILISKIERTMDKASERTLHTIYVLLCRLVAMEWGVNV